jgi:hypothetical protein
VLIHHRQNRLEFTSTTEVFIQENTVVTHEALGLVGTVLHHWAANFATKHWIWRSMRITTTRTNTTTESCTPTALAQVDRVHKIIIWHRCHITVLNFPTCVGYFIFRVGNRNKNVTRRRRSQPQRTCSPTTAFDVGNDFNFHRENGRMLQCNTELYEVVKCSVKASQITSRKQDTFNIRLLIL